MNTNGRLLLFIAVFCFSCISLYGEVFSFWPFRQGSHFSINNADSFLQGESLRSEPVIINNHRTTMNISIVDSDPENALRILKKRYPKGTAAMNKNGLLFSTPAEKGFVRRILVASPDGIGKGAMFSMTVPEKGFRKNPAWPHTLPIPSGSEVSTVIIFPRRKSVFGQFRTLMSKEECLSNITMQLKADGWISPSRESGIAGASGEIMLSADAREVIIIGITPVKGSPYVQTSLYRRKLK